MECMNHPGWPADEGLVAECGPPLCAECAGAALLPPGGVGGPGFLARALEETFGGPVAVNV